MSIYYIKITHLFFAFLIYNISFGVNSKEYNNEILNDILRNPLIVNNYPNIKIEDGNDLLYLALEIIRIGLNKTFTNTLTNISENCSNDLIHFYGNVGDDITTLNQISALKLITDTTKNKNDLSSLNDCQNNFHLFNIKNDPSFNAIEYMNTFSYIGIQTYLYSKKAKYELYYNLLENKYKTNDYIFGLCLPRKVCTFNEFSNISEYLYKNLPLFLKPDSKINYVIIETIDLDDPKINSVFFKLIPLYIIVIIILLNLLPFFFSLFFNKKKISQRKNSKNESVLEGTTMIENKKSIQGSVTNNSLNKKNKKVTFTQILRKFFSIFDINENLEELFNSSLISSNINNDAGLIYLKGLRGLSMLFMIFGFTFFALINCNFSIKGQYIMETYKGKLFYFIFYLGLRYSPRILLSCSGYSLVYKMNCFLDDYVEEIIDKKNKNKKKEIKGKAEELSSKGLSIGENNSIASENHSKEEIHSHSSDNEIKVNEDSRYKRVPSDVPFSLLFKFYFYQLHKWFLYILLFFFYVNSLYYIIYKLTQKSALWNYFREKIVQKKNTNNTMKMEYIMGIFSFASWRIIEKKIPNDENFTVVFNDFNNTCPQGLNCTTLLAKEDEEYVGNYLWLIENEFFFFFITTLIIFIGYRYKLKYNHFLNFLAISIILTKIGMLFISFFSNNPYILTIANSRIYYFFADFGAFFIHPIYNYVYFLIGVYFGSMNYILQKGISYEKADKQQKPFLFSSIKAVRIIKKRNKKGITLTGIFFLFLLLFYCFLETIAYSLISNKDKIEGQNQEDYTLSATGKYLLNFFQSVDIELVIIFIHFIIISYYIKGCNFKFISLISDSFWNIWNKLYFCFILLLNPTILFIFFISDSVIIFNLSNIFLYSLICGLTTFVVSFFAYILFELPLKRLIKLIFKPKPKDPFQETDLFGDNEVDLLFPKEDKDKKSS